MVLQPDTVMKKFIFLLVLVSLVVLPGRSRADSQDPVKVFCWSRTPQAKAVLGGLERVLGRSLPVVTADADYAQGEILIKQLAAEKLQLLIVLGTQALTLTAPNVKKTPVVFAMVADPYHSGAAYNKARPDDHQENIVGIASPPPLEEAIRQTQKLFPDKRRWGLLYDPFEGPSVELKQYFVLLAQEAGLELTALPVSPGAPASAALKELPAKGVQVVFIPPDQLSSHYAPTLASLGKDRRFVVINGNPRLQGQGAVLSVTLNYEALGEAAAHLVQRLLGGEKIKGIPIVQSSPVQVEVNDSLLSLWAGYPPGKK
jgi:putative tryptophan/tyrosine transport system substrate-binding protein